MGSSIVRRVLAVLLLLAVTGAAPASSAAATPVKVGETPHFAFYGTERTEAAVDKLLPVAEARYLRSCAQLEGCARVEGRIDVIVTEDPAQFAAELPHGSPMAEWAVGVAFPRERKIILRAHGTAFFSLLETFDHEISHVLVHALAGGRRVPVWFLEGIAIWQAGEGVMQRLGPAQGAALTGNLIPFDALERFPADGSRLQLAYAQSALFVRWLERHYGTAGLQRLFERLRADVPFPEAFEEAFGAERATLEARFAESLEASASPLAFLRNGDLFWVPMVLLFIYVAWVVQRRRRAELAAMEVREEEEEAWAELEAQRQGGEPPTLH